MDSLRRKISGRGRSDSRAISRVISGLSSSIGSITVRPTDKQLQEIDEIPAKLEDAKREVDQFIETEVPKLNKILGEQDIKFLDPNRRPQRNNNQRRRFF